MPKFNFENFMSFMKNKDILTTAISFVIAGMMKNIIFKLTNEVILPLTNKRNLNELSKIKISEYVVLIINLIVVSYCLFMLDTFVGDYA